MLLSLSRCASDTEHGSLYIQHFGLKTEGNYQAQIRQGQNQQNAYRALALKTTKAGEFRMYFSLYYQIT